MSNTIERRKAALVKRGLSQIPTEHLKILSEKFKMGLPILLTGGIACDRGDPDGEYG